MISQDVTLAPCAAVIYAKGTPIDALLGELAATLQARGKRVVGVLQDADAGAPGCCDMLVVRELGSDFVASITENRGRESSGCKLDPRGLAIMAGRLEASLDPAPDLLVLNRFGKAEIEGGGLRSLFGIALERGIAVLTAVKDGYAGEWAAFHQGLASELPAEAAALHDWAARL